MRTFILAMAFYLVAGMIFQIGGLAALTYQKEIQLVFECARRTQYLPWAVPNCIAHSTALADPARSVEPAPGIAASQR